MRRRPSSPPSRSRAQLDRIQRPGVQEWRRLHVDDGIRPVDLQIPGAPLSVRNARARWWPCSGWRR